MTYMDRPIPGFGPHLVKGLGHVRGHYDPYTGKLIEPSHQELVDASNLAEQSFREALKSIKTQDGQLKNYSTAEDWDCVQSPELKARLMKLASPDQLMVALTQQVQQLATSLQKDISLVSPVSSGLVPYDLEAPAKLQYPLGSPLRNKIPRTKGMGTAHHFNKITAISGSQQDFSNSFFIPELPGGSFNVLNLPPSINLAGAPATVAYAYMGQSNNTGLLTEMAMRGYQDDEALLTLTLLQSMMLQEEGAILYSRFTSALSTVGTPTCTAQTPTAGHTAITGMTTHIYVKVTAFSGMGETAGQASAVTVTPSSGQDVLITWTDIPGAMEYRVYVSTGASDPGDAQRYYAGRTPSNSFELSGALPTTGSTVPVVNTTQATNGFDGMFGDLMANGTPTTFTNQTVANRLNASWSQGCPEIQTVFGNLWEAGPRARPQEVWMSGQDRLSFSRNYLVSGGTVGAYRMTYLRDEQGNIAAGQVVASIWNETTGDNLPLTVHPWIIQGNVLVLSYQIPYPNSSTPNCFEMVMVQDYLGLSFPVIDLAKRFAIVQYGALIDFAPPFSAAFGGVIFS